jgi:hypothetical protein
MRDCSVEAASLIPVTGPVRTDRQASHGPSLNAWFCNETRYLIRIFGARALGLGIGYSAATRPIVGWQRIGPMADTLDNPNAVMELRNSTAATTASAHCSAWSRDRSLRCAGRSGRGA